MSLILGVGNPDRGDDGAGIHTARRLQTSGRVREVRDCSTLIDLWDGETDVTVIDATISGAEPGTITRFDGLRDRLPADTFQSTHSFGLAESVELARVLKRLPARLTIYGIEAGSLLHGAALTARVEEAVDTLASTLANGAG
jgi:hydrogenase maturation protease